MRCSNPPMQQSMVEAFAHSSRHLEIADTPKNEMQKWMMEVSITSRGDAVVRQFRTTSCV